jgi:uncharacterized membrane protein YkoI
MKTLSSLLALAIAFGCGPTFAADKTIKTVTPKVSKEKAQEAALKAVSGDVLSWDLEVEDGKPVYAFDIKGKDGRISEVEVDGNSGKKSEVGIEIEGCSSDGKKIKTTNAVDIARLKEAKLTKEQAQEKALKAYPGTIERWDIIMWEAKIGEGKLVYEFRIAGKSEKKVVAVNSKTGAILATSTFVDGSI